MPLQHRLLQPLVSRTLISPAGRQLRHAAHDWLRRLTRRAPLELWLRPDDPYCYLLAQLLPRLHDHFPLDLRIRLLPASEPPAYALLDAWYLAHYHQLSFHELQTPQAADCLLAWRMMLGQQALAATEQLQLLRQLYSCLWEHQPGKLAMLALRFPPFDETKTRRELAHNARLLPASEYGRAGSLVLHGEWYWALDDLPALISHLEELGYMTQAHHFILNSDVPADHEFLVNDWEKLALIRARRHTLDYYFSFTDPDSYLGLQRTIQLAEHYCLQLHLKPVWEATTETTLRQGLPSYGQLRTCQRRAQTRQLPFGTICLPDAQGLRTALTLLQHAETQGESREVALRLLRAIWAEGRDVGYRAHVQACLAETQTGNAVDTLLQAPAKPECVARYTREWEQLELPALPGLVLHADRPLAACGADRQWMLDMAIVDSLKTRGSTEQE